MLNPNQLRQKYFDFFADKIRKHAIIPSSTLVPENDPTTLFTGSGMQPMISYLLGAKHPKGSRIADSQKCFRAEDIEEVGDNRHTTFFEMLGNWSLGDYFKKEQLAWFFEFLTNEVGLDPKKLYVTVFDGDKKFKVFENGKAKALTADLESVEIWKELFAKKSIKATDARDAEKKGMQGARIFYYPAEKNWWSRAGVPVNMPVGEPGGPDSEVFYDFGADKKFHENSPFKDKPCHVNCDCGRFLEIGNSVFMQYQKTEKGFEALPQKNVDFGGGFERIIAAAQDEPDIFKTEIFEPIIKVIEKLIKVDYAQAGEKEKSSIRVIADHLRAAIMLAADGVLPSNKEQGYVARRLIRRAIRYGKMVGIEQDFLAELVPVVAETYQGVYPEIEEQAVAISTTLEQEEKKFRKTLVRGLKEFEKAVATTADTEMLKAKDLQSELDESRPVLTAQLAFKLYESYGFPLELSIEEAVAKNIVIPDDLEAAFAEEKKAHQERSRTASAAKFKGGLSDSSEITTKYHTATHLIHAALRKILGKHVAQKGSNITAKRLRFDFSHPQALTQKEIKAVEEQVNQWIEADFEVKKESMSKQRALDSGALAFFAERYPDEVTVYSIFDLKLDKKKASSQPIAMEICGGPHVKSTAEIGKIKIFKEKAVATGVRRVYAKLA
ncbi:MAG: alanine--tRNA ligase [Candidatus Woesebacteria bacterium]|jgi:alanyl-tRNA synthetase